MNRSPKSRCEWAVTFFLVAALVATAFPDHPLASLPWQFLPCPGGQFWSEDSVEGQVSRERDR